jgi:hypothetical protein
MKIISQGKWENNVSMVLLTTRHLETQLYDTANIERANDVRMLGLHLLDLCC